MSQRAVLVRLLREAGAEGVDNHELVYRHGITRAASIVFDLRREGLDIATIDRGTAPDGNKRLCTYVLKTAVAPSRPATHEPGAVAQAFALELPCGCVRAEDGKSWATRCEKHR